MRIVYVLTSLGIGGAERQALAVADRMAGRGHTVALLVLRPHIPEQWPTTHTIVHLNIRKTPLSLLAGIAQARRFLGEFRPDLLHSHSFHANMTARLLRLLIPSAKVVSSVHNVYEGGWGRMMAYRLTDWLACRTIAVSQAAGERFVRLKAVAQRKCEVVTNGIDTAEFAPDAARRERMRTEMGAGADFIWIAAGRVVPAKDYPNLLRAFAQLRQSRTDARLWIAGEGSGPEFDSIVRLQTEHGLGDAVRWLGLRRDMPALLDAADGFVLSSAWEGMPLAVAEAMAMRKTVVATDVGGVRELVGDTGAIVPPRDPQALAQSMLGGMERSEEDRQDMGRAARARIEANFNIEEKADEWEALYRRLVRQER
jgi:glycosyltransferase involved in cell wall biosynthesis